LFDFLLFSGARVESAREVCWEDVHWDPGRLHFRKAKRGEYDIPLFAQLRELLEKIRTEKPGNPSDKILPTASLARVLGSTCQALGLPHLSHHDLRHIFATRCIESGVDIPTVSRWLGHKDGGALAMKTYGHLRQTHSQQQAATVDFLPKPKPQEAPK
jgi:integrase